MESRDDFVQQFREKQLTPDDLFKDIQEVKEKLAEVRELLQPRNVRSIEFSSSTLLLEIAL